MWGRSGHAPLTSPGVACCCRHYFEAGCSGKWAASGVRSYQRGAALSHMPSHHTCLALPLPYLTVSLSVCVTWPLGDGQHCLLQLPATKLSDKESWGCPGSMPARQTDGHAAILQVYPAFSHSHPWTSKFLCPSRLVEHWLLLHFFIPPVPCHQN